MLFIILLCFPLFQIDKGQNGHCNNYLDGVKDTSGFRVLSKRVDKPNFQLIIGGEVKRSHNEIRYIAIKLQLANLFMKPLKIGRFKDL